MISLWLVSLICIGGLVWASLLNGLAHRLLKERSLLEVGPKCTTCDQNLSLIDVLPLISHMIFGGKCRLCASPISFLYPFVEFFGASVFVALWYTRTCDYGQIWTLKLSVDLLFASALLLALRTDLEEMVILRVSSLYLIPVWWIGAAIGWLDISIAESFLGSLLGYLLPWVAGFFYKIWRGNDGIGVGDFELLAMMGAFLGSAKMLDSLMIASVSGILVGFIYAVIHRDRMVRIPFGPFLALGALIELFR